MRCRESFMQIDVHHIESHITRTTGAQHGIQVSAIIIHQTATIVDELRNLRDARLKKAEGIGIGHHHRSNVRTFQRDQTL